jgi:outer membrane murein-binding lipoprotein Lpp
MNLEEQIGAIDAQIDQLSEFVRRARAEVERLQAERTEARDAADAAAADAAAAADSADATAALPTLRVARPSHNALTLTIGSQTVALHPEQIGQLIEELANARASMSPEPPMALAPGWRFASTRNPVMAMQKQANGDRLLVARHTGHGWVPFTFSPDAAVQLYMMLTQR